MLCSFVLSLAIKWVIFFCLRASLNIFDIFQAVNKFICELRLREMNPEKWCKIAVLALDEEEWMQVHLFSNILQVCLFHILYFPPNSRSFFSMLTTPSVKNLTAVFFCST